MAHKRKGQLTVSGEWARHLRPFLRRMFWKGERQAAKDHLRVERAVANHDVPSDGTIEHLLAQIEAMPPSAKVLELWVPDQLTLRGQAVPNDAALVVVLDKVLEHGLLPQGFIPKPGGKLYTYASE